MKIIESDEYEEPDEDENDEYNEDESDDDENDEDEKKKYSLLVEEHEALKTEYAALEQKCVELTEFKNKIKRNINRLIPKHILKEDIFASISYVIHLKDIFCHFLAPFFAIVKPVIKLYLKVKHFLL